MVETRKLEEITERKVREKAKELFELEGEIEELVEGILSPDREGYSCTWSELVEEVIKEVVGEEELTFFPLAECWDLLVVLEGRIVLGIAISPKAPLGWSELIESLEEIEKQVRKLLEIEFLRRKVRKEHI